MMKFETTAEFGDHTVFSSINHADPQVMADIVHEHDLGTFVGQIVRMANEGTDADFETIGEFDTFDQAKRALECEVSMTVKVGE